MATSRRNTTSGRRPRATRTQTGGRGTSQARQRDDDDVTQDFDTGPGPQEELVRGLQQVWLAGLGAIARAPKDGPAAFGETVVEGLRLLDTSRSTAQRLLRATLESAQGTLQSRAGDARTQAQEAWGSLESLFQSGVHRAMRQFGVPTAEDIRELTESVAELHASVERMGAQQPRSRKTAKTRPSTRTARKPRPQRRPDDGT
ncbi:MAG TPA: phasin family protein [Steroidobacteraceae bacterium]|nr:phasin family protein [Steroidobacteraceae bacterium]